MIRVLVALFVALAFLLILAHALVEEETRTQVVTEDIVRVPPRFPRSTTSTVPPSTTSTVRSHVRLIPPAPRPRAVDFWYELALCETGGTMNPRAYNPAGPYYSYFQWSMETWRAAGGTGHPFDASYETQKALAIAWAEKTSISSQWPRCSREVGAA